jgi:outer membrane receptor protein involved in Fe transport
MSAIFATPSNTFSRKHKWNCVTSHVLVLLMLCFSSLAHAQDQPPGAVSSQHGPVGSPSTTPAADPGDSWHADLIAYLWLAGAHGTIGIASHDVDFRASPTDLLQHFRFGLMGTVQARRGRYVFINDLVWVRLGATNTTTLPISGQPSLSAEAKAWQFILTPAFGYRFLDGEKIKIDALMLGFRYWHVGSSLQFTPSPFGRTFSKTLNWADPLMGARILFPLSPKVLVTIGGDAGAWGGAQLDYEIVGSLGYKLSSKFTLTAGYRYLYVDYRPTGESIYKQAMSGALIGVNYHFK